VGNSAKSRHCRVASGESHPRADISDDADSNAVVHLNGTVDQITLFRVQTAELSDADFVFTNVDLLVG
jgi:hypothetical protein